MATAAPTDNRVYLYRLLTLNIDCGTTIVRNLIDDKCSNTSLTTLLAREKGAITKLRANKIITKAQFDLLYPQSGIPPTTSDFDLTLALCLLRSLKHFGLIPKPGDPSLEADLCRLRIYRNELAHIPSTTGIKETDFIAKWADMEGVLHRLNGLVQNPVQNLQQIIDDCKTRPLDPEAEKEIEKQIETMQKMEEQLEIQVQNIKKGVADHTEDIQKLQENFIETHRRIDQLEKQGKSEGHKNVQTLSDPTSGKPPSINQAEQGACLISATPKSQDITTRNEGHVVNSQQNHALSQSSSSVTLNFQNSIINAPVNINMKFPNSGTDKNNEMT